MLRPAQALPTLALLALAAAVAPASEPATVALYVCKRCDRPPAPDGHLDDLCWQGLPVMDAFYQYWTPVPKAPPLKTVARACYDESGLYLGITLYDEHIDNLKAAIHDRDNPLTWTDDCVEIMVDPANSGSSYLKFCTNYNAARYDERSADLELDGGWNVEGWRVATSRDGDSWTIELSLPWSDIGSRPHEGDIWSFDLVRYSYSTGSFRGVTWSLGGAGAQPHNFGYLAFGPFSIDDPADRERLAEAAAKTKGPRLQVLMPDSVRIRGAGGGWVARDLASWITQSAAEAADALAEARQALERLPGDDDRAKLANRADELAARLADLQAREAGAGRDTVTAGLLRHDGLVLRRDARDLKWGALLAELVALAR